jgi:hypothetical protein
VTAPSAPLDLIGLRERAVASLQSSFLAYNNQDRPGVEFSERIKLQEWAAELRNSIGFRLDSVLVHLDLLNFEEARVLQELVSYMQEGHNDELQRRTAIRRSATRQRHLFDDITFAVVSAFDYFGNLVGLVAHGGRRRKMKWKRLIQYASDADLEARHEGSTWVHDSMVAAAALTLRSDWLAEVSEYRADAIHYRADAVDGHMSINWVPGPPSVSFHAYVPNEFVRRLSRAPLRPPNLGVNASLIPCAEWLAEQTLTRMAGLADVLARDIGADPLAERQT